MKPTITKIHTIIPATTEAYLSTTPHGESPVLDRIHAWALVDIAGGNEAFSNEWAAMVLHYETGPELITPYDEVTAWVNNADELEEDL